MNKAIHVLLVEDHPLVRQGIKDILFEEKGIVVAAEAPTSTEALAILNNTVIDVAVVDISLKGSVNGIELIHAVKKRFPAVKCVVLSMHSEMIYVERSIKAGALGYVLKSSDSKNIVAAIYAVHKHELYIEDDLSKKLLNRLLISQNRTYGFDLSSLTNRELEIFELIGYGNSSKEIAVKLNIAHNTIDAHRRNIKEKLQLQNSSDLVKNAIQWVILKNK